MHDRTRQELDPGYADHEDTPDTSLAARLPFVRWYRSTTRGLGASRPYFMPLGFACLCILGFYQGFPALEELALLVLAAAHRLVAALGAVLGTVNEAGPGDFLSRADRLAAAPVLATLWAAAIAFKLVLATWPVADTREELGYVVPGSGMLARAWGVIGKRLYQLRQGVRHLASYLRDLNIEKLALPLCLPPLLLLAGFSAHYALSNLLFEIPAGIEPLAGATGWIPPAAGLAAAVITVVLGLPMLANILVRTHRRSVRLRQKQVGFVRRRLRGLGTALFALPPLVWMALRLLAD